MHHTALRLIAQLPEAFSQLELNIISALRHFAEQKRVLYFYFYSTHLPHEVMSRKSVKVVDGKLQETTAQLLKSDAETIFIAVDENVWRNRLQSELTER